MKTILAICLAFALTSPAGEPALTSKLADVLKLSQSQIEASVIQAFINNCPVLYNPSLDQIVYLQQQGVSDDLISAILKHDAELRQRDLAASVPLAQTPAATVPITPEAPPNQPSPGNYAPSAPVEGAPEEAFLPSNDYYWDNGFWGWAGGGYTWIGPGWRRRGFYGHAIPRGDFHGSAGPSAGFHPGGRGLNGGRDGGAFPGTLNGGVFHGVGGADPAQGGAFERGGAGGGFHAGGVGGAFHGSGGGGGFHGGGSGGGGFHSGSGAGGSHGGGHGR